MIEIHKELEKSFCLHFFEREHHHLNVFIYKFQISPTVATSEIKCSKL